MTENKIETSVSILVKGRIPEWPNGADCKSAGLYLRWFESIFAHTLCGSSSVDRASAFQAEGREFEPRLPLDEDDERYALSRILKGCGGVGRIARLSANKMKLKTKDESTFINFKNLYHYGKRKI